MNIEMNEEKKNKLKACLSCTLCKKILHYPVTLYCQDNFCKSCLKNYILKTNFKNCPSCKTSYFIPPVHNFKIHDLIVELFPEEYQERELEINKNQPKLTEEESIKEEIIKNNWRDVINGKNNNFNITNEHFFIENLPNYII